MDNEKKVRSVGVASVVVAGIFVVCMVFIIGKVVFATNSAVAPEGIDTATINTNVTEPKVTQNNKPVTAAPADNTESGAPAVSDESSADTASSAAEESSSAPAEKETKYITEYAYLHTQPSNEAENIVCMTPGVAVTVLGYEDNGYVKITFTGNDGELTGYIYQDYLSEYQTVLPPWEQ